MLRFPANSCQLWSATRLGTIRGNRQLSSTASNLTDTPPHWKGSKPPDFLAQLITPNALPGVSVDPAWSLGELTPDPKEQKHIRLALVASNVNEFEFLRWRNALVAPTLSQALAMLEHGRHPTPSIFSLLTHRNPATVALDCTSIPHWVFSRLISHGVRSPLDASLAFHLVRTHMSQISNAPELHLDLLQSTIRHLTKYRVYYFLPQVLDYLLHSPSFHQSFVDRELWRKHLMGALWRISRMSSTAYMFDTLQTGLLLRILRAVVDKNLILEPVLATRIIQRHMLHSKPMLLFMLKHLPSLSPVSQQENEARLHMFARAYARAGQVRRVGTILDLSRAVALQNWRQDTTIPVPAPSQYNRLSYGPNAQSVRPNATSDHHSLPSPPTYVLTPFHQILLSAFQRDPRARDSKRFPHALFAYFSTIQPYMRSSPRAAQTIYWSTFFESLSAQKGFSSDRLLAAYTALNVNPTDPIRLNVNGVVAIIRGLVLRRDFEGALRVWEEQQAQRQRNQVELDPKLRRVGVKLFAEVERLEEAMDILGHGLDSSTGDGRRPPHQVDHVTMSEFLFTLARTRRADLVYAIFHTMEEAYGLRPDDLILSIVLYCASEASRRNARGAGMLDLLGWQSGRSSTFKYPPNLTPHERLKFIALHPTRDRGFWWGKNLAWETARDLFRSIILSNYPELQNVYVPALSESPNPTEPTQRRRSSLFTSSREDASTSDDPSSLLDPSSSLPLPAPPPPYTPPGTYHDLIPTERSFDSYIRLLVTHGQYEEIPEALAWMRALRIPPQRQTLRMALMGFAEVGTAAPLTYAWEEHQREKDERPMGLFDSGRIGRLKEWLVDWVGYKNVPRDAEVGRALVAMMGSGKHKEDAVEEIKADRNAWMNKWRGVLEGKKKRGVGRKWREELGLRRSAWNEEHLRQRRLRMEMRQMM